VGETEMGGVELEVVPLLIAAGECCGPFPDPAPSVPLRSLELLIGAPSLAREAVPVTYANNALNACNKLISSVLRCSMDKNIIYRVAFLLFTFSMRRLRREYRYYVCISIC
jgi:hypothetical protein